MSKTIDLKGITDLYGFFKKIKAAEPGSFKITGAGPDFINQVSEAVYDYSVAYRVANGQTGPGRNVKERPLTFVSSDLNLIVTDHNWNHPAVADFYQVPVKDRAKRIIEEGRQGRAEIPASDTKLLTAVRNYSYGSEQPVTIKAAGGKYIVTPREQKKSLKEQLFEIFARVEENNQPESFKAAPDREDYVRVIASKYNRRAETKISISAGEPGIMIAAPRPMKNSTGDLVKKLPKTSELITELIITPNQYKAAKDELQGLVYELKARVQ